MRLTKSQKKNLLLIDEGKANEIHINGRKSLFQKNLIYIYEDNFRKYDFSCLTNKGIAATKIAKREELWERFDNYTRQELVEKCELAFQHSLATHLYENEEMVDMLVNKYEPITYDELMMFV